MKTKLKKLKNKLRNFNAKNLKINCKMQKQNSLKNWTCFCENNKNNSFFFFFNLKKQKK